MRKMGKAVKVPPMSATTLLVYSIPSAGALDFSSLRTYEPHLVNFAKRWDSAKRRSLPRWLVDWEGSYTTGRVETPTTNQGAEQDKPTLKRSLQKATKEDQPTVGIVEPSQLPLSTNGANIVDKAGRTVRFRCVNWAGAYNKGGVVNGLTEFTLKEQTAMIKASGFNCVRLPFSLDMWLGGQVKGEHIPIHARLRGLEFKDDWRVGDPHRFAKEVTWKLRLRKEPRLFNETVRTIFMKTVEALTDARIMVILNNHVSSSGWCCSHEDGEGLWYAPTRTND